MRIVGAAQTCEDIPNELRNLLLNHGEETPV